MNAFYSIADFKNWRNKIKGSIGFVPTMGALHAGHVQLLKVLRPQCDFLVLSIFVNPIQFGPREDFSKYPRTLENDLNIARSESVDAVLIPSSHEMYPEGFSTYVEETVLSTPLCGEFRPDHFKGVTTVVLKLFHLIKPQIALFGIKDAQQFFIIKKMVQDLGLDIEVKAMPTVRENDGLALSSRNRYLSLEERKKAPALYQALLASKENLIRNKDFIKMLQEGHISLKENGFNVQYFECVELPHLNPTDGIFDTKKSYLIATAAYLGTTRLIDNILIHSDTLLGF